MANSRREENGTTTNRTGRNVSKTYCRQMRRRWRRRRRRFPWSRRVAVCRRYCHVIKPPKSRKLFRFVKTIKQREFSGRRERFRPVLQCRWRHRRAKSKTLVASSSVRVRRPPNGGDACEHTLHDGTISHTVQDVRKTYVTRKFPKLRTATLRAREIPGF